MELYSEIIRHLLETGRLPLVSVQPKFDVGKLIQSECYQALRQIKSIIEDDGLDDPACFQKIEAIVRVFETLGSNGGNRHNFG